MGGASGRVVFRRCRRHRLAARGGRSAPRELQPRLGAAGAGRAVRRRGAVGPAAAWRRWRREAVARLRLGEGDLASSVHIDNGEGCGWPGALLVCARRGGAVRLFDIRRLSAANARCAPPEERARASLVLELAGRPAAPVRTDGAAAGGNGVCFAADAARVICGAGARSGSVSMWPVASGRQAGEEEAGLAVATRPEPTPRCRQRKPRGTRKEWSH